MPCPGQFDGVVSQNHQPIGSLNKC